MGSFRTQSFHRENGFVSHFRLGDQIGFVSHSGFLPQIGPVPQGIRFGPGCVRMLSPEHEISCRRIGFVSQHRLFLADWVRFALKVFAQELVDAWLRRPRPPTDRTDLPTCGRQAGGGQVAPQTTAPECQVPYAHGLMAKMASFCHFARGWRPPGSGKTGDGSGGLVFPAGLPRAIGHATGPVGRRSRPFRRGVFPPVRAAPGVARAQRRACRQRPPGRSARHAPASPGSPGCGW